MGVLRKDGICFTCADEMPQPRVHRSSRIHHRNLFDELQVIASDELADVLAQWSILSDEQEDKLAKYLREELDTYGMLSVEKGREAGQPMAAIRKDARHLLRDISERQHLRKLHMANHG